MLRGGYDAAQRTDGVDMIFECEWERYHAQVAVESVPNHTIASTSTQESRFIKVQTKFSDQLTQGLPRACAHFLLECGLQVFWLDADSKRPSSDPRSLKMSPYRDMPLQHIR